MPAFRNTDNGRVIEVADNEAFIYEKASNFELVDPEASAAGAALAHHKTEEKEASAAGAALQAQKKPRTTKKKV